MGLVARIESPRLVLQGPQRITRLGLRLARKEVDRGQILERSLEALHRRVGLALAESGERWLRRVDPADELAVLRAAIEELACMVELRGGELDTDLHREPVRGANLGFDLGERRESRRVGWQEIDAVAQHPAARTFQGSPHAHADGRIPGGKAEDEGGECGHDDVVNITIL